jgi:hypothetical protein
MRGTAFKFVRVRLPASRSPWLTGRSTSGSSDTTGTHAEGRKGGTTTVDPTAKLVGLLMRVVEVRLEGAGLTGRNSLCAFEAQWSRWAVPQQPGPVRTSKAVCECCLCAAAAAVG